MKFWSMKMSIMPIAGNTLIKKHLVLSSENHVIIINATYTLWFKCEKFQLNAGLLCIGTLIIALSKSNWEGGNIIPEYELVISVSSQLSW